MPRHPFLVIKPWKHDPGSRLKEKYTQPLWFEGASSTISVMQTHTEKPDFKSFIITQMQFAASQTICLVWIHVPYKRIS